MKRFIILCLVCIAVQLQAQTEKAVNYINKYKDIAMAEMVRSGVPASITLAQGLLESGFGESDLCVKSNNHFGIKCKNEWTGEKVYHDDDAKGECFRKYNTSEESYKDHSDFLKSRPHYSSLFQLEATNYVAWAKGLKKAGYATEKDYPQKLIKVIEDYNLNEFTLLALQQKNQISEQLTAQNNVEKPNQDTEILGELIIPITSKKLKENNAAEQKQVIAEEQEDNNGWDENTKNNQSSANQVTKSNYPDGVFTINHCQVIWVKAGTSLLSIAQKHGISFSRLLEYNDMDDADILTEGKLIFLEKKLKKGNTDFHIVKDNETAHDICQLEGVRLESILEFNNIKKESKLKAGSKIFLRAPVPFNHATNTVASY